MRRALSVLAASTAATTDPVSAFAFNAKLFANTVAGNRLPASASSCFVEHAPQARMRCRAAAAADGAAGGAGTRMGVLSSDPSPSVGVGGVGGGGSGGAYRLGEGCKPQRVFDPQSARRRRTAGAAKENAAADGDRVWNTCKERVELGTSGLMVSRVRAYRC